MQTYLVRTAARRGAKTSFRLAPEVVETHRAAEKWHRSPRHTLAHQGMVRLDTVALKSAAIPGGNAIGPFSSYFFMAFFENA